MYVVQQAGELGLPCASANSPLLETLTSSLLQTGQDTAACIRYLTK